MLNALGQCELLLRYCRRAPQGVDLPSMVNVDCLRHVSVLVVRAVALGPGTSTLPHDYII